MFELWLLQNFFSGFLGSLGSVWEVATKHSYALDVCCLFGCLMESCVPFSAYRAGAFWPDWWVLFLTLVLAHNQVCPEPADGEQGLCSWSWSLRGKQLTCSKHLAWKPWRKSCCIEWRAGEGEAAQSFKGEWIEVVASVSLSGLEWSEQESPRSHFMAELNADEALLTSSTEHLCLHASVFWTPLYAACATYTRFPPFTFPCL